MINSFKRSSDFSTPQIQDYITLSKQNQQLLKLIELHKLQNKKHVSQLNQLEKQLQFFQNENDQYRIINQELKHKLDQYQIIKEQLLLDYEKIKKQIGLILSNKIQQDKKYKTLSTQLQNSKKTVEKLQNISSQNIKKDLLIDNLNSSIQQLREQLMLNKLKMFNQCLNDGPKKFNSSEIVRSIPRSMKQKKISNCSYKKKNDQTKIGNQSFI